MSFSAYLKSFKSSWGLLILAITSGPIALFAGRLALPWPSEDGGAASMFCTATSLVGVTVAYFQIGDAARRRRRGLVSLALAPVALLAHAAVLSMTYVEIPQYIANMPSLRRYVVGFVKIASAQNMPKEQAVQYLGLDAWTETSLLLARITALGTLLSIFFLLTFGFGTLQNLAVAKSPRRAK